MHHRCGGTLVSGIVLSGQERLNHTHHLFVVSALFVEEEFGLLEGEGTIAAGKVL